MSVSRGAGVVRKRAAPRRSWAYWSPRRDAALARALFALLAVTGELAAIVLSAVASGELYHRLGRSEDGQLEAFIALGALMATLFILPNAARKEYNFADYFSTRPFIARALAQWNIAALCALALGFLTKTSAEASRGTVLMFFVVGFAAVAGLRAGLAALVRRQASAGGAAARRVFLVGFEDEMESFTQRYAPWDLGMRVIAASVLRQSPGAAPLDSLGDDLALAAAAARMLRPDDVFILVPWSQKETIDACLNAFLRVPAAIHLGPERVLDRFADARIDRMGRIASLNLVRRPLSVLEISIKRAFDIVLASVALGLAGPLLLALAILIRCEGQGPVVFQQRRYGFNREPFLIYKFRSMHTGDDGRLIEQARPHDPRITRIGRFMRRWNLDELPQLVNVLKGEMSLVGPRPHALAHDQHYDPVIALYARRHNVRPGITGWAQVNGLRGETQTRDQMRLRVEHDLFYIDNWSLLFDLRILVLTLVSPKAYRNAV